MKTSRTKLLSLEIRHNEAKDEITWTRSIKFSPANIDGLMLNSSVTTSAMVIRAKKFPLTSTGVNSLKSNKIIWSDSMLSEHWKSSEIEWDILQRQNHWDEYDDVEILWNKWDLSAHRLCHQSHVFESIYPVYLRIHYIIRVFRSE